MGQEFTIEKITRTSHYSDEVIACFEVSYTLAREGQRPIRGNVVVLYIDHNGTTVPTIQVLVFLSPEEEAMVLYETSRFL